MATVKKLLNMQGMLPLDPAFWQVFTAGRANQAHKLNVEGFEYWVQIICLTTALTTKYVFFCFLNERPKPILGYAN